MYIWASVKFSIPLAIFYLALQHYRSGQAIITTVIFHQLHVEDYFLLLYWAKEIHKWYKKFYE